MHAFFEEERIVKYHANTEVPSIIADFISRKFLCVEHSIKNKTLTFKKFDHPPENREGARE